MPGLEDLSDEELKKLYEGSGPAPGAVEGTARAIARGAIGLPKEQAKDVAFANQSSAMSAGGGMLGRAADIMLPFLGGRAAGGALARNIKKPVNPDLAAGIAEANAARRYGVPDRNGLLRMDQYGRGMSKAAIASALEESALHNKSAQRLESGLKFGGGLVGGTAGGAAGAYLHGEDPQSGALYGAGSAMLPAAGSAVKAALPSGGVGNFIGGLGTGAAATAAAAAGAPSFITQALKDYSLGKWLNMSEGKKK